MDILEAIKENQQSLKVFLEKEMYLHTSVPLRLLLCDGDNPLLIKYSEEIGRPLFVWTITSLEELSPTLLEGLQFDLSNPCNWDPRFIPNRNKIPVREFLARKFCAAKDGNRYTPSQIIKATANKLGFTHFDQDRQKYLKDSLDWKLSNPNEENQTKDLSLVDSHLFYLAKWTIEAIDYLIEDEVKFTAFYALDKIENTIGDTSVFCIQTGGLLRLEFDTERFRLKAKEKEIEFNKVNGSFICVKGATGKMTISSNLLEGEVIIPYSNIVTSNSIRSDVKLKNIGGNICLYNRLLNDFEVGELRKKESRKKLIKELKEEKNN
ncbi:hypothetical protein [Gaoshiqia sediminis]|uniref:Uncharacterized protein n=1 Tax=Gaoshiqia sediminis TaxID=2986998 RepID=A0AA42C9W5_9BACT|nr:hypothetical protein [Gaoshiqia sediminis]MCW0482987.1 hypothetical protein [Gaoshiqia sediminis]